MTIEELLENGTLEIVIRNTITVKDDEDPNKVDKTIWESKFSKGELVSEEKRFEKGKNENNSNRR